MSIRRRAYAHCFQIKELFRSRGLALSLPVATSSKRGPRALLPTANRYYRLRLLRRCTERLYAPARMQLEVRMCRNRRGQCSLTFWADWYGPGRMMNFAIEALARNTRSAR